MTISANFPAINPALLLDFANTKALDPRITFSRPTTATYYDNHTTVVAEQNFLLQSQTFTTSWSTSGATAALAATTAPNGTTTGNSFTEDTSTGVHRTSQAVTVATTGTSYTFSCYVKYSNCQYVRLSNGGATTNANFDLVGNTVTSTTNTTSTFITSAGGGWYRIGYTSSNITSGSTSFFIEMLDSAGTANSYTGTSRVIYLWGAQLEQRSSVTAYTPTTTTAITNYIPVLLTQQSNEARFDHNPTTRESLGLLIEEQRTNLSNYSEQFDNAYWTRTNSATVTANTLIAPDGTLTADKLVSANSTNTFAVYNFTMATLTASTYTISCYAKAGEVTWISMLLYQGTGGVHPTAYYNLGTGTLGSVTGASATATITAVGNGWYRCTLSGTTQALAGGGAVYLASANGTLNVVGNGYSGAYIWGSQLEAGAFATSYIPTVASQVTRSADSASMTGTNFSSWYNNQQGTLYAEILENVTPSVAQFMFIDDSTGNNNRLWMDDAGGTIRGIVQVNNVSQAVMEAGNKTIGVAFKTAMAYKTNDFAQSFSGATVVTDSSGSLPAVNRMVLASAFNGYVKKLAYYPIRVSNLNLQSLTGN